jgi:hypothetical protein
MPTANPSAQEDLPMSDSRKDCNPPDDNRENSSHQPSAAPKKKRKKKHISMHEGIAVWADCCSCEAEPYWRELAEEMGVDLNEYEDEEFESEEKKPPAEKA